MASKRGSDTRIVTRRQWLKATGTGLATATLAGCSGSNESTTTTTSGETSTTGSRGGGDDEDTTEDGGDPMDAMLTLPSSWDIARKDIGFNNFNSESKSIPIQSTMAEVLMGINAESGELVPHIVEDVQIDGETMTATVNTDYGWSNGTPITAKDLETMVTIRIAHDYSVSNFVESVSASDDETAEFQLTGQANPEILKQQVFLTNLETSHEVYGEYATRFKEASGEEEMKAIKEDLQNLSITFDENVDKLITSGPVKFSDVNNKRVKMVPNEHHPHSDAINFDGLEFLWVKDSSSAQSLLKSDQLDAMEGQQSRSFLDSLPDHHETTVLPEFGGNSIDFYLQDDLYGDVQVRQAFNYLIDQKLMSRASDFVSEPVKYMAGMPDFLAEQYIPSETLQQFPAYERDPEKAASLLQDAGFSKEGGTWHKPNGDEWKPSISVASGSTDRIKEISVAVANLKQAGVQAEMSIQESSTYWKSIRQRDYKIATYAWGDRGNRHPYFDYDYMWIGRQFNEKNEAWNGLPDEIEVPGTVGDPSSSTETWNIREMTTELGKTQDTNRQQELITKLAWAYNQYVVKLPVSHSSANVIMTRDHWNFPAQETLKSERLEGPQHLLRLGKLRAKTE